ncbi:MAG TPA: hypothetical protein ENO22_00025 [candidate division Zixibacteria bacterium]|nr:hypothetical protein [candidate division Zixibacteria bacterium]
MVRSLFSEFKPDYVLHHPHTTVKTRIWIAAWKTLEMEASTDIKWASAGKFCEAHRDKSDYDNMIGVMQASKSKNISSMDLICSKLGTYFPIKSDLLRLNNQYYIQNRI